MNFKVALIALGLSGALVGVAQAADNTVSKKITLTAQINDALFVSKPDGSTWYGTEELDATDYMQKKFTKTLPVRVWSTNDKFNISLAQPLKMSNGAYEMANASVNLGDKAITHGAPVAVTQTVAGVGGYDQIHNLGINVDAPTQSGAVSTNGSYTGDLVMIFEPVAAAEQ
ncbi:CS1 type fimbrial major subunit [Pseudomonas lundensis]|uniref:CS1 type fimbrial major subunit n=1 Tax=Pseudomonas lundensis TaxID=86185 RepID=UPI00193B75A8|nr:CS1 type fimbrial major subunit [Pseudomonas lundensis]MBM1189233.1 fimbrial assembly protein [Pseudomonas lundensis]